MYFVIYSSITHANRVKRHFKNGRYRVDVVHTPTAITEGGCSYALKVEDTALSEIIYVSELYKLNIKAVYKQSGNDYIKV